MARYAMQQQVAEDMRHIPRGGRGSAQNKLRFAYPVFRQHDLAGQTPPSQAETMRRAIGSVLGWHPGEILEFDRAYFGL